MMLRQAYRAIADRDFDFSAWLGFDLLAAHQVDSPSTLPSFPHLLLKISQGLEALDRLQVLAHFELRGEGIG